MEPMAERAAAAEPEMAPKTPQVTTLTAPSPPLILSMKSSMTLTKRSPIPPLLIMPPAIMNIGIASNISAFIL
ncbi:hypothetical protein ES703_95127 [subsurface metagenome]